VSVEVQKWRTKDMALAAYLCTRDLRYERLGQEGGSCYWYFVESDDLLEEVDKFLQGDALVEPGAFNNNFARMKREMFKFLEQSASA
jgi:hypothetical protein